MANRAWCWIAVLLVLTVRALTTTAQAGAPSVVLAGTTVFRSGTAGSSAVVRLVRPATFTIDPLLTSPQVHIAGAGRYGGLVMTRRPDAEAGRQTVGVVEFTWCWQPGCRPTANTNGAAPPPAGQAFVRGITGHQVQGSTTYTLTPGTWDVLVLSDGAAQQITMRLPGLSGTRTISAITPSHGSVVAAQPPSATAPAGASLQSFGQTHTFRSPGGVLAMAMDVQTDTLARSDYGACYLYGTPPTGELAYSPGCPGAQEGSSSYQMGSGGPYRDGFLTLATTDHAGPWSQGLWQVMTVPTAPARALLVWIQLP